MNKWASRAVFSLNSFAAAMLALLVALGMGLPRPYWAMLTVYVVSQPLAGTVRSKALYRLLGTAAGAAMTVIMVPALSNSPEILTLAMALWVGVCLGIALLDRTPRSYSFMLAGYTAALIGFPSVNAPAGIFDTAIARVEEIGLGITAATFVHSIFLPQGLGATLQSRIIAFLLDARGWVVTALRGEHDPSTAPALRLAADLTELQQLASHLPFDTSHFSNMVREIRALSERMAMLLPLASAVGDRLSQLRGEDPAAAAGLEPLLADCREWLEAGFAGTPAQADALIARAKILEADVPAAPNWAQLLRTSLLARLAETITVSRDCRLLTRHIQSGGAKRAEVEPLLDRRRSPPLHLDYGMAAWSGLAAAIAVLAICSFWIVTGWQDGATAAMMTAVFMCFFATMDNPVPAINSFAAYTLLSMPVSALYLLAIMPAISGFPMLMLALAPLLLIAGYFQASPPTARQALAFVMGVSGSLAIQETLTTDFASFINGSLAQLIGVATASAVTVLIRSVSADFGARRILRLSWRDLARISGAPRPLPQADWISLMVDRVGLLAPRLRAGAAMDLAVTDVLGELRVGVNVLDLQRLRQSATPNGRMVIGGLLDALKRYFTARARQRGDIGPPSPSLLARLDDAIVVASEAAGSPARRPGLIALTGLRRNLFPQALPFAGAAR